MIKKLETSSASVVVLEARGEITSEDYESILIPEMQNLVKTQGGIRGVIFFDETFTNFTLGAIVQDGLFGVKNISEFKKVAIVGLHNWMEELVKMGEFIAPNVIKRFDPSEKEAALAWANS